MKTRTPRISLNKLGEYLTATPLRRRAIIKAQQEPPPSVVPLYQKAYPILETFFKSGDSDELSNAVNSLRSKAPASDWEFNDNQNTALALEAFLHFASQIDLSGLSITRADQQETSKLLIGGVAVSVRPDFYLRFTHRKQPYIGALKFHWTKDDSHSLTTQGGAYVATTVHQFLDQHLGTEARPSLAHCYSIDVFRHSISEAPKGFKLLRRQIEAACEEIALRWDIE